MVTRHLKLNPSFRPTSETQEHPSTYPASYLNESILLLHTSHKNWYFCSK